MPIRNKSAKSGVLKKAVEWFKKPFRRQNKKVSFDSDSEDYSSSSGSESDSESYSESESDTSLERNYIAGVSSQAHLVAPEQQSLNLRYPLRKNPKPSLKALEARQTAKLTQRKNASKPEASALKKGAVRPKGQPHKKSPNETKQESISAPSAPPLYPTLPPFSSPIPPVYQPYNFDNQNFREEIVADQTLDRPSFETRALTNQAIEILQGIAPRSDPFVDTPTNYNTKGFRNLAKLSKSIHLKYNCSLRDATSWAQQLLEKGIDPRDIVGDENQLTYKSAPLPQKGYDQFCQQLVETSTPPIPSNPFATTANNPFTSPCTEGPDPTRLLVDDFNWNIQPSNRIGNSFSSQETAEAVQNPTVCD